jgi:hypothetical protein
LSAAGFLPVVTVVQITAREGITEKGDEITEKEHEN